MITTFPQGTPHPPRSVAPEVRESHWQRGLNDQRAGRPAVVPYPMATGWAENHANTGYTNGYRYGCETGLRHQPADNEGSEP